MSLPGGWELFAILLVIMVLFGAKRLPDASRSLGRSLRIFKAETKGLRDDDSAGTATTTTATDARYDAPSVPPVVPPAHGTGTPAPDATQPHQP